MTDPRRPVDDLVAAKSWLLAAISPAWLAANPVQWSCKPTLPKPQPDDEPSVATARQAAIDADAATARASIRALASEVILMVVNPFMGEPDELLRWQRAQESGAMMLDELP